MAKIKVMVIDDDFYVREALEMLLRKGPITTVSLSAPSPDEAITLLKKYSKTTLPEVILLDVKFENIDQLGTDYIESLKKEFPSVKVLIASMTKDEKLIIQAISMGADGYVWKNESGDGIISAIERIMEGRFVITKSIAEKLIGKAVELKDYAVEILPEKKEYQKLTEDLRKTMYLYCFCGMSAKEIAEELCLSVHTINSRIKTAYQILRATNRSEAFNRLIDRWE